MTASWRDEILQEFSSSISSLIVAIDPDGLLLEDGILEGIKGKNIELLPFDDSISFRYVFESKFRSKHNELQTEQIIAIRVTFNEFETLPYDLIESSHKVSLSLDEFFPNLSYPVISQLDFSNLDMLFKAQENYKPGPSGDNATKEFILRHVFKIAPEVISKPSDLLRILLKIHFQGLIIPSILYDRLVAILHQANKFNDWPLEEIIPNQSNFFAFLQERWPIFLDHMVMGKDFEIKEPKISYGLKFNGQALLPFDHDDVRVYIDNLFIEGFLQPISYSKEKELKSSWASVGVIIDPIKDRNHRIEELIKKIQNYMPNIDFSHHDWLNFVHLWTELSVLVRDENKKETETQYLELRKQLNETFIKWCEKRFSSLHNHPPIPPVMLHHIARFIARQIEENPNAKYALIVIDGMAFDQWQVIRKEIKKQNSNLLFNENAVFAWLPSLTSVSRQTLFAGKAPLYFPASIQQTNKEPKLWSQFWQEYGLNQSQVIYKNTIDNHPAEEIAELVSGPSVRVAGLIINKVDKIMHGMEMGAAGMLGQVRQWAKEGYLANLIEELHKLDFNIFITSDHGNIEVTGCGCPSEGATADVRGERCRIYPNDVLRSQVKLKFPDAIDWQPIGLPEDFLALFAPNEKAFITEEKKTIAHGGISLEEVIVPFVKIERRKE